jgi:CelD/BcsL family acetyltransferase involved in cellulose biosynthesis
VKLETIAPSEWSARLQAWSGLLEQASEPSVFLSPEWIRAWWRAYGGGHDAMLWAAHDEQGGLVGLAPLYVRRVRLAGLVDARVIGVMGDEGVGSEYLGLLVRPGREAEFLSALAEVLAGDWAVLDFRGLPDGGALARLIPEILGARALERIHCERHPCAQILLPDDYEAYLRSLKPKFRSTLRYRTNKLLKNNAVRLLRTSREEELGTHLARFFAMHQERWVARAHPGSFHDPRMRAFYRDMAAAFLRRGWLRFDHLEVDGVIRASQFGFAYGGVLHSLQEAFDLSFHPPGVGGLGVILRGMVIRESITEGLKTYDFLGGVQEFKARWETTTQYVQRVRIGAAGHAGFLAFALTAGWDMTKDWGRAHVPGWLLRAWHCWESRRRASQVRQAPTELGSEWN